MLMQLVENVENDLQSTTKIKNRLNSICDISWSLICPPGTGNAGKFIAEKARSSAESKNNSEENSSLSKDLYSNVTELINYGKLVRSKEVHNQGPLRPENDGKNINKTKHLGKALVKDKCLNPTTGRSTSLDSKSAKKCMPSISRNYFSEGIGDNKNSSRHENISSSSALVSYSHSCSSQLSEQIHSIKFAEDLNNLFRLFNSYVDLRSGFPCKALPKHINTDEVFRNKLRKCVKSKLQTDLQNTSQCAKYMKYIEASEEADDKRKFQEPPLVLYYRSKEQLELFETTCSKLFKLQLQSKLLNSIARYLSETDEGVLE